MSFGEEERKVRATRPPTSSPDLKAHPVKLCNPVVRTPRTTSASFSDIHHVASFTPMIEATKRR